MTRVERRKKLLADEYNIHSEEEFASAYEKTKSDIDFFISVFGKERHETKAEKHETKTDDCSGDSSGSSGSRGVGRKRNIQRTSAAPRANDSYIHSGIAVPDGAS